MLGKVNLLSDSTIALCWIQGYKRLPTMVTTLVQKIGLITKRMRDTSNVTFYHVPTHENIADCATRGVTKNALKCHRWWSGPIWLNTTFDCWSAKDATNLREQNFDNDDENLACTSASTEEVRHLVWPLEQTNSLFKLLRVASYCARFIRRATRDKIFALKTKSLTTATSSAEEITFAEKLIIRREQTKRNSASLMENKKLNVKLDSDGILRKYSRLQNADVSFDTANPNHIPKQSNLGHFIALRLHNKLSHCGTNQLLYNIRQRYWIPQDRVLCKRILNFKMQTLASTLRILIIYRSRVISDILSHCDCTINFHTVERTSFCTTSDSDTGSHRIEFFAKGS
ncbi:hypothetical protein V3C99_018407 [Haemonchus contortus]|uniref:RNase H domain-containing protein n=1 Tax=Haemonchus contortus TaxID=6289 RepID=A0A7I4Z487_HAECO